MNVLDFYRLAFVKFLYPSAMKKEKASPVECDEEGMEENVPSTSKQVESDGKFPVPKLRLPARVKKVIFVKPIESLVFFLQDAFPQSLILIKFLFPPLRQK